ncbi:cubilin, partial [Biomphalaria glabrata]
CGGKFVGDLGTFKTPTVYSASICTYQIEVPAGKTILLKLSDDPTHLNPIRHICDLNIVLSETGFGSDSVTYPCLENVPTEYRSSGNQLFITYDTESENLLSFIANFSSVEGRGCGGYLNGDQGFFQSPGFPESYIHNENCTWYITVSPGHVVRLTFQAFNLEYHSNCLFDYVDVYDSDTPLDNRKLNRFCGQTIPPAQTSTSNVMVVQLRSDHSIVGRGFQASYIARNDSFECGGTLVAPSGSIKSPNYPSSSPAGVSCEWVINVSPGMQIVLNVSDFDVQDYRCLEIRNGGYQTSPLLMLLCQPPSGLITSHTNQLYIKYRTGYYSRGNGFYLQYYALASGCGGEFTAFRGIFQSPNYPDPYPPNSDCQWTIRVAQGSKIILSFDSHFEVHCYGNYIEVPEGRRKTKHLCGYYPPAPVTFTNNLVVIKFRSSPYARGIGFRASYVADCNNRLNGTFGAIESPNFPNPYPHEIDCLWTIDVPLGNKINSHFGLFKLEDKHNGVCNYDYVEVRGSNLTNNKFCGEDAPVNNFLSNANTLAVQFHSDSSLSHLGFKLEWIIEGCGETFNLNTGIITSPNYPRSYNNSQTCIWDITVSEGNVVNLTLTDFDVETHRNCYFDGLFVYSEDISEEPIVTLCHTQNSTQSVTSESNHMIVLFKSDSSVVGRGFNAIFNAVQRTCGKDFTTRSGTLTSKNYPNAYDVRNSVECSWTIKVEANHIVNLTFSELDLNCQNDDFIDIYSGENSLGTPLASSLCQLGNTSFYLSESNQMFIRMRIHYSWYNSHKGFRATYITACGGTLDADEGIIMSPFFPGRYNRNSDCVWHITRTPVYLTFSHMDIPDYNPCTTSYLFLSYGENNNTYCGQAVPRPIYSESSPIMVNFHSGYLFGTGFKAKFSTYLTCSGNLTALTGSFVSPHYPQDYPDDTECTWQITASPGNSIQLNFNEFELTGERNNDYLEIHSPNQAGPVVGRWFGNQGPGTITGLTGAWILFRSDYSGHSKGFLAEYVQVCGGTLTNASGQIASLLYPSQYPSNIHCMWTIIVQENKTIQITFDDFNIHSSQFGSYDVLMILDGDQFSSSLGMYSNSNRPPSFLRSTSNIVTVIFHSDYYNQLTGFLLSWITVSSTVSTTAGQECRGDFLANSTVQVLTSPDYPNLYANNLNCFWTITAPLGKRVSITINNMSLEGTSYYCHDYLQFHNALNQPAVTGRKCSDDIVGRAIYSSSNSLGITFVSDFSIRDQGFYITYHEDCGSTYTGVSSGIIQSTNYSNNYSPNQDCTWQVTARTGKTIKLDFSQPFDIAGSAPCQQDYLKLFNGPTSSSPPLILNGSTNINGTYCGQTAPQGLETSSNQLFVQFVSDENGSGAGFSFTFSEVSITCGGTLTLTDSLMTGFFTSPNYPNDYPHNVDCTWRIIAPALTRIRVDFVDTFFIEDHNNCTFDYIEFRDGSSFNSPRIGQPLCGTRLPSTIYSNSNLLFVRFRTDDSVGHEGFKVKYSRATCGGRIASTSGTVTSPNFPSNYRNNDECEWELQGAVGHYLYFTLDTLSFPQTENCTDFLMIRDGNATDTILFNSCTDQSISQNTSDNKAYVQFKADGTLVDRGFKFHFDSSLEECGGNLYLSSGEFTSPNFPNLYSNRRTCVWNIFAPQDRRITLTFTDFDLENDWSCSFDFIH